MTFLEHEYWFFLKIHIHTLLFFYVSLLYTECVCEITQIIVIKANETIFQRLIPYLINHI